MSPFSEGSRFHCLAVVQMTTVKRSPLCFFYKHRELRLGLRLK